MVEDDVGAMLGATTLVAAGKRPVVPAPTPELPQKIGRYTVLKVLGVGGMGVVYAAYDTELDRKVAIKLLQQHQVTLTQGTSGHGRLLREAQAMAKISHPNVLQVFEAGTHEGQVFLALELVEGCTLAEWQQAEPRTWQSVIAMYLQAGRGLEAAHAAGFIHRDFKPDNVLIDATGRARVMDFGLARTTDRDDEPAAAKASSDATGDPGSIPLSQRLTIPGSVMGTPLYMAPEQHLGATTDPRTDVFALCVALYEALYGDRPFAGDNVQTLAFNVVRGMIREPPPGRKIPRWLHRCIVRGLASEPSDRFPNMTALLVELGRDRNAIWRRSLIAGTTAVVLIASGWGLATMQAQRGEHCRGGEARFAEVWNDEHASALKAAFAASKRPYAAASAATVQDTLDAHASAWVDLYSSTCSDHARGEISPELLDLHNACLERRRSETSALVELLKHADASVVDKAPLAAMALPAVALCADRNVLLARIKPPEDPQLAAEVARLQAQLDQAKAAQDAGKFQDGLALAMAIAEAVDMTGYRPVIAETQLRIGELQSRIGAIKDAETALWAALWAADAGRHDEVAAASWTELVRLSVQLGRQDDTSRWAERATAAVARLGDDRLAEARLENELGTQAFLQAHHSDAALHYRRALELRKTVLGPKHPEVAAALSNLGNALVGGNEFADAEDAYSESLALREAFFGPKHPDVASTLNNLGVLYRTQDAYTKALEVFRRAETIYIEALGPDSLMLLNVGNNLANVYQSQGDNQRAGEQLKKLYDQAERTLPPDHRLRIAMASSLGSHYVMVGAFDKAEALLRATLALREQTFGADHPQVGETLGKLAHIASERGDTEEAFRLWRRSLAITEAHFDAEHRDLAWPLGNLAALELRYGDRVRAEALARRALTIVENALGPTSPSAVQPLLVLAGVELKRREPQKALELLDRVAVLRASEPHRPDLQAAYDFLRAQAVYDAGGDRDEARRLAEQARSYYTTAKVASPGCASPHDHNAAPGGPAPCVGRRSQASRNG